jgi:hypothetical protein
MPGWDKLKAEERESAKKCQNHESTRDAGASTGDEHMDQVGEGRDRGGSKKDVGVSIVSGLMSFHS